MKVEELLTCSEGKTLEFKRDLSSPKPILRTLVAFANTAGGTVIIGRDDNGNIVGVSDILSEEERLANLVADSISPTMMPDIEAVTISDKSLLLVRVAHWPGPFFLKEHGPDEGVYVRLGSTNRKADKTMLEALRRLQQNASFDQLPHPATSDSDLDHQALHRWFAEQNRTISTSSLVSLGILVRQGGGYAVSHGGLILFGTPDARQRYFPDAYVSCARFRSRDKSEFVDRQNVDNLLDAFAHIPKFIARHTRLASKISGI